MKSSVNESRTESRTPTLSPTEFDIVIVGGGLVGASLAAAIANEGYGDSHFSVAVIEAIEPADAKAQTRHPSFDDRQTALAPSSRRFFEGLGLWSQIEAGAAPILDIHVSDRGHGGFTRLNAEKEGLPALGHVVSNRHLGAVLSPAMERTATVFRPAEITELQPIQDTHTSASQNAIQDTHTSGYRLRLSTPAGEQTLTARLLLVADGMRSKTRGCLGIGLTERHYNQSAVIANVRTSRPHRGTAYERFTPDGPLAMLPAADGAVSLVWTLPPEQAEEAATQWTPTEFLAALQTAFGWRLGRLLEVSERHVYPLIAVTADQFVTDRAVILGNAAHALHPVAGQGLNLALRDVDALAKILAESLASITETPTTTNKTPTPTPDPYDPQRLAEYEKERRADYRRTFTFTDGLVRIFSNQFLPLVAVRNVGLTLLDLFPPARRLLLKQATGGNFVTKPDTHTPAHTKPDTHTPEGT